MSNIINILNFCNKFYQLAKRAKQKPIYMYHGTSYDNLQSILSQGLISNPINKVWQTDDAASFLFPSRTSVGGIYFTKNILTAISSASNASKGKHSKDGIIVIAEIKPNSLLADEDVLPSSLSQVRMPNAAPHEMISCYLWGYLHVDPTNPDLISAQDLYINICIQRIKESLKINEAQDLHPKLERRLKDLFQNGFNIALARQISHVDDYSYQSGISRVLERNQNVEKPNKSDAEAAYRKYLDQVTKILKTFAISEISREYGLRSGRVDGNIGYYGGNRIVGILKLFHAPSYKVEVIYEAEGGIPSEAFNHFIEEYSKNITSDFELVR